MNSFLFIATGICCFAHLSPIIIKYIIRWFYLGTETLKLKYKQEILALEREIDKISIVDDFSKHTKLRRKYTKLIETYKLEVSSRLSSRIRAQLFITYVFKIFNWMFILILTKIYIGEPVIILPEGCLSPFQNIFSWPGFHENSISLSTWIGLSCIIFT